MIRFQLWIPCGFGTPIGVCDFECAKFEWPLMCIFDGCFDLNYNRHIYNHLLISSWDRDAPDEICIRLFIVYRRIDNNIVANGKVYLRRLFKGNNFEIEFEPHI